MDLEFLMAAYGAVGVTLLLIAGGWITVREYFKRKAANRQAEIDALVEKRLIEEKQKNSIAQ